jgi:hypothetical protein
MSCAAVAALLKFHRLINQPPYFSREERWRQRSALQDMQGPNQAASRPPSNRGPYHLVRQPWQLVQAFGLHRRSSPSPCQGEGRDGGLPQGPCFRPRHASPGLAAQAPRSCTFLSRAKERCPKKALSKTLRALTRRPHGRRRTEGPIIGCECRGHWFRPSAFTAGDLLPPGRGKAGMGVYPRVPVFGLVTRHRVLRRKRRALAPFFLGRKKGAQRKPSPRHSGP